MQQRADHKGATDDEQRVTIGRRLGDEVRADVAGCAGAIVGDHADIPALGESRPQHARNDVGARARRVRNDDLHIALRIDGGALRARRRCVARSR